MAGRGKSCQQRGFNQSCPDWKNFRFRPKRMDSTEEKNSAVVSTVYGAYYSILPLPEMKPELQARLRGKLRLNRLRTDKSQLKMRHLICAGDRIRYASDENNPDEYIVESVLPRRNAIFRSTRQELHCMGANLDYAVLISSLARPEPNFRLVDRFLSACHNGAVKPILVFTKSDLLTEENESYAPIHSMISLYRELGFTVFLMNLLDDNTSDEFIKFRSILQNSVTLLCGKSGTGKSTLINKIAGKIITKTADISLSTSKGKHTTTNSRLVALENQSAVIDSPGIKEWGLQHLDRRDIIESFPELRPHALECPFKGCLHESGDGRCKVQNFLTLSQQSQIKTENGESSSSTAMNPERIESLNLMLESLVSPDRIRTGDYIKATGRLKV